jgi:hypothetical protein
MNPVDTTKALEVLQWLQILSLGALMGAIGQVVRMVVGLKKLSDAASDASKSVADCIEPSRMVVSLVLGATAGALASIGIGATASEGQLFTLAAAGYSGADLIEGFASRVSGAKDNVGSTTSGGTSPDGAVG